MGAANPKTDHGFLGSVKDPQTGLNLLGARYYDSDLGRFMSVDPLLVQGSAQSANAYAYGNNNPMMYVDPTGLGGVPGWLKSGANWVTDKASDSWHWAGEHKSQIAGAAVAVGVGLAIGATCATVVGCIVVGAAVGLAAGAAGGATTYAVETATTDQEFSASGLLKATFSGGLWGAAGGGVLGGALKLFAPFLGGTLDMLGALMQKTSKPVRAGLQKLAPAVRGGKGGVDDAAGPQQAAGASSAGGGSTSGTGRLVDAVNSKAQQVIATQSNSQRGPVLSGAMDRESGTIFFGQNTGIPSPIHPEVKAAIDALSGPGAPFKGVPGAHSEINAVNEGLLARPGATISDFVFYSVRLRAAGRGQQILMCPNCSGILKGAKDVER